MQITTKWVQLIAIIPLTVGALVTATLTLNLFNKEINSRLQSVRKTLEENIKNELEARITTTYGFIQTCYLQGKTDQECLQRLGTMRFGENDANYLWIHLLDPENIANAFFQSHPRTDMLGKNLAGMVDLDLVDNIYHQGEIYKKSELMVSSIKSTNVFFAFNKVALESGQGIVYYYWPKAIPGQPSKTGYPKMSYIKYFEPFKWVIGAGEYADVIDELVNIEKAKLKSSRNNFFGVVTISTVSMLLILIVLSSLISRKVFQGIFNYERRLLDSSNKLKKSEKRLYDIASSSGDIIWEIDDFNNYVFVSGATQAILGVEPESLIGTSWFDNIPEENRSKIQEIIHSAKKSKQSLKDLEIIFISNGKKLFIQVNGIPVVDDSGDLIGYRGVYRDISRLKEEEARQQRLERELQQAQKMEAIGTLAAGIAHEINTPAQFIGSNIEFLSESFQDIIEIVSSCQKTMNNLTDSGAAKEHDLLFQTSLEEMDWEYLEEEIPLTLNQSKDGVKRIASIVSAMKEFSHPGSKEKIPVNIAKLLETTIVVSRNEWKYVADLETDIPLSPSTVLGFPDRLSQVFLNLIVNAAHSIEVKMSKHSEVEKGVITIRLIETSSDLVIHFTDTGSGIPKDVQAKIFDPFFTTKGVGKGTGQGLTISHDVIVGKHNGTITFETEAGEGTTFIITLPKEQGDQ